MKRRLPPPGNILRRYFSLIFRALAQNRMRKERAIKAGINIVTIQPSTGAVE